MIYQLEMEKMTKELGLEQQLGVKMRAKTPTTTQYSCFAFPTTWPYQRLPLRNTPRSTRTSVNFSMLQDIR